ncbi:S41 family peptidase [uncultured Tenacibaculum sp.]|uniref:S41 family peptidase n=1 Tax=uncultured Tenacibaculum sp. TaxID=174713 RepID=UPI0026020F24|nr:S41 family peptidase [uncultured Tenacibaculum sp.]
MNLFKSICLSVLLYTIFSFPSYSQELYFAKDPALTPDGKTIIFSYDEDLWKVPSEGGNAYRITAMEGEESRPSVSPDGKWIAFSANQYGNRDIYIIPVKGGEIKQLTFHDGDDLVSSWSWDSKKIFFSSSRENSTSTYEISISGETPKRLFPHFFNRIHNLVQHPKDGSYYFNESWESSYFAERKRYKGDFNPDIKSYNPKTKVFKKHTNYKGKDFWTTIDKNGTIYFASDEKNGEHNLYTFKGTVKTPLTEFKTSVFNPKVNSDGTKIVFSKDYQIHVYDIASKKTKKVNITIYNNNTLDKSQDFNVRNSITYFDVSPDNKKMAFVSRGRLFISDTKGKFIRQIPLNAKERVVEVKWLNDNRTLLYSQTYNGYLNLFTIAADGKEGEKQITKDVRNNVNIVISPDYKKAAYLSGRDYIKLLDLENFKSKTAVKDEFWALYPSPIKFSPNNEYLLYNAFRDFENDIFTYNIKSGKIINLTQTGANEGSPFWSPDGKYIYFNTGFEPTFPRRKGNQSVYRMALNKYDKPYRTKKLDDLFKPKEKDTKKKDDKSKKAEKEIKITINEDGLMDRLDLISPSFGNQTSSTVIAVADAHHIYYISNHDKGSSKLWKTTLKPFEKPKTEKVADRVFGYLIVSRKKSNYILYRGNIHTLNVQSNKTKAISINYKYRKSLSEEFQQMFEEAWAGFEENFYDEKFHNEDWSIIKKRYSKYLPYITKRTHLRRIFNDMLGELNTSHVGFRSFGKEENKFHKSSTLSTGIVFSKDNPYKVERIIKDGPADVVGNKVKAGDILVAVNGVKIDSKRNREFYFSLPSLDREMELTFKSNAASKIVNIHPIPSFFLKNLLHDEWVDNNQSYVDKKSNNRIAYIHMKDMGSNELKNFKKEMVSEYYKKDALILDLRNNTGGNVHNDVLNFLSQKPYLQWKYRGGKLTTQPNFTPAAKPIVLLINEQSLSDAEVTAEGFKQLKLGKVIGTETYRWIIFTSGKGLVDGSFYRLPSWGCYTLNGEDLEKTGVKPDIYVKEDFKDRINGLQPQLDRAILEIMKELPKK